MAIIGEKKLPDFFMARDGLLTVGAKKSGLRVCIMREYAGVL